MNCQHRFKTPSWILTLNQWFKFKLNVVSSSAIQLKFFIFRPRFFFINWTTSNYSIVSYICDLILKIQRNQTTFVKAQNMCSLFVIYQLSKFKLFSSSLLKETVSVILRNSLSKDGNARFTRYPLGLCLIKYELDIHGFLQLFIFTCGFLYKFNRKMCFLSSEFLNRNRFEGYRCESGIVSSFHRVK